ncbi:hypothetical protein LTR40_012425, partial [Exophiala xenobiotica]
AAAIESGTLCFEWSDDEATPAEGLVTYDDFQKLEALDKVSIDTPERCYLFREDQRELALARGQSWTTRGVVRVLLLPEGHEGHEQVGLPSDPAGFGARADRDLGH